MKSKRKPVVVDTNVPIVANQQDSGHLVCAAACASALHGITKSGLLVLDDEGLIFNEYKGYLSFAGQPGVGDYFFKWLCDNRYKPDRVAQIILERDPKHPDEFAVYPRDLELSTFDHSDRKFVAVALSHRDHPPILNATDDDWWNHKDALSRNGITVRFVCGEDRFQNQ